jgi:hypothetical protein
MRERSEGGHVFLDRSGRRRRLIKIVGVGLGTALATVLVMLVAALSGVSPVHVPGLPEVAGGHHPRPAVSPTPVPSATSDGQLLGTQNGNGVPRASLTPTPTATPAATPTPSTTKSHGRPSTAPPHPSKSR